MHLVLNNTQTAMPDWLVENFGGDKNLAAWFWREYLARMQQERRDGIRRQKELVSRANFNSQHHGVDGLGQVMFRIDPLLRKSLAEEFGWEAVNNEEFWKELIRDNPEYCFKPTYERKAAIVVPATKWQRVKG